MSAEQLIVWTEDPLNAETPLSLLCRSEVTPTELFFVRSHGSVPVVEPDDYRLALRGLVREPLVLSLRELRERFPRATVAATLACAGNRRRELSRLAPVRNGIPWGAGAVGNAIWTGVRLRDLLVAAGIASQARHVAFTDLDGVDAGARLTPFGGSIPVEKALADEVLLAYEMNGKPVPPEHGFPLRAVVPGYIGARSVKWLSEISVQFAPSTSLFQTRDYMLGGPARRAAAELCGLPAARRRTAVRDEAGRRGLRDRARLPPCRAGRDLGRRRRDVVAGSVARQRRAVGMASLARRARDRPGAA